MWYYFQYLRTYLIIKRKQWLDKMSGMKGLDYTAFVILCEPRSGSTLLHTYLNSHSQVISYGEVLRMELEKTSQPKKADPLSDIVFTSHAKQIKAVGLKLFYSYVDDPDYARSFDQLVARKDVKVIHLVRKNLLELYVSLKTAEQTNVWSATRPSAKVTPITVDVDDYSKFIATHKRQETRMADLFKDHTMLTISYDDLAQAPEQTLLTVQKFLGVQPQNLFTLLARQSQGTLASRISNYAEVQAFVNNLKSNE